MRSVVENSASSSLTAVSSSANAFDQMAAEGATSHSSKPDVNRIPSPERFIDACEAADFVKLNRKTLLRFARQGSVPAHPLSCNKRRKWRFLISELDAWARAKVNSTSDRCQNSGGNECWHVIGTVVSRQSGERMGWKDGCFVGANVVQTGPSANEIRSSDRFNDIPKKARSCRKRLPSCG
jgi:Helix-turn-helix domain